MPATPSRPSLVLGGFGSGAHHQSIPPTTRGSQMEGRAQLTVHSVWKPQSEPPTQVTRVTTPGVEQTPGRHAHGGPAHQQPGGDAVAARPGPPRPLGAVPRAVHHGGRGERGVPPNDSEPRTVGGT